MAMWNVPPNVEGHLTGRMTLKSLTMLFVHCNIKPDGGARGGSRVHSLRAMKFQS